jgi:hypothetical protein
VDREYKDDLFRGPALASVDGAQQLPGGKLAPGYLPSVQAAREPIRPTATGWKADEAKWRNDYKGPPGVIPTPGMYPTLPANVHDVPLDYKADEAKCQNDYKGA